MKKFTILFCLLSLQFLIAQNISDDTFEIKGLVQNAANDENLRNVHVINLNSIKGATSNNEGEFKINAKVSDTLYFTFIGFKPLKARVTNDWVKYGNIKVKLTEIGIALEEVIVSSNNLTGFVEIDIKNIPVGLPDRYQIPGLETSSYEGGDKAKKGISRAVKAVLNPINSLYNIFARKPTELNKLRKVKEDEEIRNLLQDKFSRETLTALLGIEKVGIDEILRQCNYSKEFIKSANDLQILDAISECYDEYKVLSK